MAPSNHSRQSTRKTSPGFTVTLAGMSGCQRLCPRYFWSVNFLVESRGNTTSGIQSPLWVGLTGVAGTVMDGSRWGRASGAFDRDTARCRLFGRSRGGLSQLGVEGAENHDPEDRECDGIGFRVLGPVAGEQQERRDGGGHDAFDGSDGTGVPSDGVFLEGQQDEEQGPEEGPGEPDDTEPAVAEARAPEIEPREHQRTDRDKPVEESASCAVQVCEQGEGHIQVGEAEQVKPRRAENLIGVSVGGEDQ